MKQYFRYLTFLLLTVWSAQAFALDEIDRFVKRCEILTDSDFNKENIKNIKEQKKLLRHAAVPIHLSFADCNSVKHIIKLENGHQITVESHYSSKSNDDYRNTWYSWSQHSPSPKYWLFTYYGMGGGWALINKNDGQRIHPNSECGDSNDLVMRANYLAVICQQGSYQNHTPTLYILKISDKSTNVWSKPIVIQNCDKEGFHSMLITSKFKFVSDSTLRVIGKCELSNKSSQKFIKVDKTVQFDENGLTVKSDRGNRPVEWD